MDALPTAEVYLRQGRIYVAPEHRTQYGFGLSGEPVLDLPDDADDSSLGAAVRAALAASRTDFILDRAERNKVPPVQATARARSWSQFIKGARALHVTQRDDGSVHVVGFAESEGTPSVAPSSGPGSMTDAQLGRLVRRVAEDTPKHSGRKP